MKVQVTKSLMNSNFWDITPCSLVKVSQCCTPEERTLQDHQHENLKSYKINDDCQQILNCCRFNSDMNIPPFLKIKQFKK
jgi:hypothetical protein